MYLLGEVDMVFYCLEPAFSPVKWTLACPREGDCKDPVRSEIKKALWMLLKFQGLWQMKGVTSEEVARWRIPEGCLAGHGW